MIVHPVHVNTQSKFCEFVLVCYLKLWAGHNIEVLYCGAKFHSKMNSHMCMEQFKRT